MRKRVSKRSFASKALAVTVLASLVIAASAVRAGDDAGGRDNLLTEVVDTLETMRDTMDTKIRDSDRILKRSEAVAGRAREEGNEEAEAAALRIADDARRARRKAERRKARIEEALGTIKGTALD